MFVDEEKMEQETGGITLDESGELNIPDGFWDEPEASSTPEPEPAQEQGQEAPAAPEVEPTYYTPEEVAEAVVFLGSPAAGYITGATVKIDGGIL